MQTTQGDTCTSGVFAPSSREKQPQKIPLCSRHCAIYLPNKSNHAKTWRVNPNQVLMEANAPFDAFHRYQKLDRSYYYGFKYFWRASQANKGKPQQIHAFLEHTKNKKGAGREEQSKKTPCHLKAVFMMHKGIFSSHNKELWLTAVMSGYSFFPAHRAGAACPALFLYFFASSALKAALAPCRSRLKKPAARGKFPMLLSLSCWTYFSCVKQGCDAGFIKKLF